MTVLEPAVRATKNQGLREVYRAEARRIRRRGGMPTGIIIAWCLGVLSSFGMLAVFVTWLSSESHVVVTAPIEAGGMLAALALAIAAVFLVGRDGTGHLLLALTLAPRRAMLHASRAAAFASVGAVVCGSSVIAPAVVGIAATGGTPAGPALLAVLLITLAGGWMALLAFGIATIARRGGPGILLFIGLIIVMPLVIVSTGGLMPPALAGVAEWVLRASPTALFVQATTASAVPGEGFAGVLTGQLGLALWAAAAAVIGGLLFSRRDA